mmetsp:Transcript_14183/g.33117  ORF Transcript_14183/g.33117 Transcript_14183/m.33117 type:complete len:161 (-) Transcript_14183:1387-1869(-)
MMTLIDHITIIIIIITTTRSQPQRSRFRDCLWGGCGVRESSQAHKAGTELATVVPETNWPLFASTNFDSLMRHQDEHVVVDVSCISAFDTGDVGDDRDASNTVPPSPRGRRRRPPDSVQAAYGGTIWTNTASWSTSCISVIDPGEVGGDPMLESTSASGS